jgi:hypothetical protein
MTVTVSHWSGRLGNNIQQVANAYMFAESFQSTFQQNLPHDIISEFVSEFGESSVDAKGRFYSWEPLVHCEKGIFEGGNEVGLPKKYIYENMRRVCLDISKYLKLPTVDSLGDDTIVMHLRSGDNYHRIFNPPTNYIPNPLCFYENLIDSFDKAILITEPDDLNPIVHELRKNDKVTIQSSTVEEDFATLMSAKHLALSGVGTFAMAAALCSSRITDLYTTDLLLTEHLNYTMMYGTDVVVHEMELNDYLTVFPCSWMNTEEQRKFILDYKA